MTTNFFQYKGVTFSQQEYSFESLNNAENEFQVLDDDVFNVTYPKSGTNWILEILSLIRTKGDPTWVQSVPNWLRSPWYETTSGMEQIKDVEPPRAICTHLPRQLFSKSFGNSKAKIIYTMRNPKDVMVSLFHFAKLLSLYADPESFQQYLDIFLRGDLPFGGWFDHVKGWMQMKDQDNFFYITYEELKKTLCVDRPSKPRHIYADFLVDHLMHPSEQKLANPANAFQDLRGSVVRICNFLGRDLDDAAIDSVVEHASFDAMKKNKMSNFSLVQSSMLDLSKGSFYRKGIVGDWKNHFTAAQSEHFDRVYQEKMKDSGLQFFWETN